jgi:hypothetical protein
MTTPEIAEKWTVSGVGRENREPSASGDAYGIGPKQWWRQIWTKSMEEAVTTVYCDVDGRE